MEYIGYLTDKIYYLLTACNSRIEHVDFILRESELDLKVYGNTCIVFLPYTSMVSFRDVLIDLVVLLYKTDRKSTKMIKAIYIINDLSVEYNINYKHNRLDFSKLIDKLNTPQYVEDKVSEDIQSVNTLNNRFVNYVRYKSKRIKMMIRKR